MCVRRQQQGGGSSGFGGELQAARRGQIGGSAFAHHHRHGTAAQALLHRPQHVGPPGGERQDQPVGIDAEPGEAGAIGQTGGLATASQADMQDAPVASRQPGGEREGEDAIRMLARHPATARRVCTRLARYFVADRPSAALVQALSARFLATQGDLRQVMRALLESPDFWAAENRLFKTPLDFAVSALVAIQDGAPDAPDGMLDRRRIGLTLAYLAGVGQPMHGWQTPDGYGFDAATWMVPEALTRRADFALALARQAPEPAFLAAYLGPGTLEAIDKEPPALRAGLMLASPEFMYK